MKKHVLPLALLILGFVVQYMLRQMPEPPEQPVVSISLSDSGENPDSEKNISTDNLDVVGKVLVLKLIAERSNEISPNWRDQSDKEVSNWLGRCDFSEPSHRETIVGSIAWLRFRGRSLPQKALDWMDRHPEKSNKVDETVKIYKHYSK